MDFRLTKLKIAIAVVVFIAVSLFFASSVGCLVEYVCPEGVECYLPSSSTFFHGCVFPWPAYAYLPVLGIASLCGIAIYIIISVFSKNHSK